MSMPELRKQFAFKGKKVNIPNIAYPNQHLDFKTPHDSNDHVIVSDTRNITFNLDVQSTDKTRSIVKNVGRALVKKKILMFELKGIDAIKNVDIYAIYNDFYLSEKESEVEMFQGMPSANGLRFGLVQKRQMVWQSQLLPKKMQLKRLLVKRFAVPLDFDFFKHSVFIMNLKKILL